MARIVLDIGHGKNTPGKRCLIALDKNETREWILNDRVGDDTEIYLKSAGHEVLRVDDITGATDVPLAERVRRAEEWEADLYVSIHHNAGINGGCGGGTVVYVYPGTSGITTRTQESIYAHAIERGGLTGNRHDGTQSADYYVLRETSMPASLIECGFMDSATDIKYILNPKWSKKIALGIAEGICEVWGGTVKEEEEKTVNGEIVIDYAQNRDKKYAGEYIVNSPDGTLSLRSGANTNKALIAVAKTGEKVQSYGYYTKESDGTIWLLVQYKEFTGFMSLGYLKK